MLTLFNKGYRKIMLNKKLNPTGPKNKKLVISLQICRGVVGVGERSRERHIK